MHQIRFIIKTILGGQRPHLLTPDHPPTIWREKDISAILYVYKVAQSIYIEFIIKEKLPSEHSRITLYSH